MKQLLILAAVLFCGRVYGQTPCENGFAGIYPCENVDLMYFMTPSEFGNGTTNEVWGWTDPVYGTEYVLLGKSNGVAFIDISNPVDPLYLGTLPTHTFNSIWRTLRVYNNYLFVCSEANNHGMQVFNLSQLHSVVNPPVVFAESAWYGGFGKCHSLAINETTGYAYACGTNTFSGGLHIVNIQNPLAPVIAGSYASSGYTHEAMVEVYNGPDLDYTGHSIALCFNGQQGLFVVDVTDPTDVSLISGSPYANLGYCHQGCFTNDQHYMLMDDELDEYQLANINNTRTLIWDMSDLDDPVHMGDFISTSTAIDHNQYVIGNIDFQSNYTAGLRLLDITDIANTNLSEVGYFDHYNYDDAPTFDGTWMSYPYFSSGVIPVTDIDYGLFLVKPNFVHLSESENTVCSSDEISFDVELAEGFAGPINLSVSGLPVGASAVFSANGVSSPSTSVLTIFDLDGASGNYNLNIIAEGAHFTYSRNYVLTVNPATAWYADSDNDGFGGSSVQMSCTPLASHVLNSSDCDDNNASMYPGATGTGADLDNDCNGIIEADELFCPDLNNDGIINVSDLLLFMANLGCTGICVADLDGNELVNTNDMLIFLGAFGNICE